MKTRIIASALSLSILSLSIGCSSSSIKSYPTLANKGILPLSTSNAYVAGNLFLAREAELSPFLYNFLKMKGGPTAVEIIDSQFNPPRAILYYPRDKEVYAADIIDKDVTHQWIIRGPYPIERKDYRDLQGLEASMQGEPLFMIRGKQQRFNLESQTKVAKVIEPLVPPPPVATPKPKARVKHSDEPSIVIAKKGDAPTEFRPLNSDQQAIQMSLGYAERAENGDVVHTVLGTESLSAIAKWYAGSSESAKAIAEYNGLTPETPLVSGARIRVPHKLVKNTKVMK